MGPNQKAGCKNRAAKAQEAKDEEAAQKDLANLTSAKFWFERAYNWKMKRERPMWNPEQRRFTLYWLWNHAAGPDDKAPFEDAFDADPKPATLPDAAMELPEKPKTKKTKDIPPEREVEPEVTARRSRDGLTVAGLSSPKGVEREAAESREQPRDLLGPGTPQIPFSLDPGLIQPQYPYPWWPAVTWPDYREDEDAGAFNPYPDRTPRQLALSVLNDPLWIQGQSKGWVSVRSLGQGGYGAVALWVRLDDEENIRERMAVKECVVKTREKWRDPVEWRDRLPREIAFLRRLHATNCGDHIVGLKGHRVVMRQQRFRQYLEFCDYGDLLGVIRKFPLTDGEAANAKKKKKKAETRPGRRLRGNAGNRASDLEQEPDERPDMTPLPEPFIWHCFYALVDACIVMRDGARGTKNEDWREIIHCDLKPHNVLIVPPHEEVEAEAGGTKTGKGKRRADDVGDESELIRRPKWPKLVVTDLGVAFDDGPENPREYLEEGTLHYRPPEHRPDYYYKETYHKHRMNSRANVWGIGAVIWSMLAQPCKFEGPVDEVNGLPGSRVNTSDVRWLDSTYSNDKIGTQWFLPEDDYLNSVIFGENSWPMVPRYSDELKTLVRQCLQFRAEARPTLDDLRTTILGHMNPDEEPPDLLFEEQIYQQGARLVRVKAK